MAQKHRMLFPINITDCQIYPCNPFCPSDGCLPDFFIPLLPPSPPPPLPPPPSSTSTFTLSPYVIISLSLFAVVSVLFVSYVIIVKRCFRRRSGARSDGHLDFLDHNHVPEIDHPIWYINSIGLHPSVINSIAVFKYKRGDAPIEGNVCPVCLSEFGDDEMLRLLPKCNHAFHIPCIDTWLRSHTNCPLCRAGILSNTSRAPSNETSDENINSGNHVEERGNLGIDNENRGETEAVIRSSDSKEISDSTVVSMKKEKGRRSVSMDCLIGVSDFSNDQLQGNLVNFRDDKHNYGTNRTRGDGNLRIGSSSSAESPHTSPISMKRSFSCSGRLFSSSRYSNKSSSSILPL